MVEQASPFPPDVISEALYWGRIFSDEWKQDVPPTVIHQHSLAGDGTPDWTAAMTKWISDAAGEGESRHRTTSVMRKLRRASPREYEVLWRTMILGEPLEETTRWLNERAKQHSIPLPEGRDVWYRLKDTVALFMAGVDYARAYY